MNDLSLMQRFADPELITQMSTADKMLGSLITTLLGMGITFIVLALLWGIIVLMTKVLNKPGKPDAATVAPTSGNQQKGEDTLTAIEQEDASLIAVITAAIAASLQKSGQSIIVKNIRRVSDNMPAWARAAKQEQIDSRRV
ncbi:MAG: OadG family protein [Clostridiales bacterium]|nr:OadG family protein [Clostridiales bacterium]